MADQRDDDHPEKAAPAPGLVAETETATDERRMYLDGGRQVAVVEHAGQQAVEIRAASGQLELRIKLTAEGPVLSLDGVKVEMNAAESLQIKCKDFKVEATESTTIESKGELKIKSDGEMELDSPSDVRIKGKKIWLN
jgi:hypothetical protein